MKQVARKAIGAELQMHRQETAEEELELKQEENRFLDSLLPTHSEMIRGDRSIEDDFRTRDEANDGKIPWDVDLGDYLGLDAVDDYFAHEGGFPVIW